MSTISLNNFDDRLAAAFSAFGAEGRSTLRSIIEADEYCGCIGLASVKDLLQAETCTTESLMVRLLAVAQSFAHAPLSHYFVGAVALGSSGRLFLGCNVEIPQNILGLAVHAEQAAVANAFMSGEIGIEAITAGASPCGHCRQFLSEVSLDNSMRVLMKDGHSLLLSDLLPRAFGPRDLGLLRGMFSHQHSDLKQPSDMRDPLVRHAWKAACLAYSPYTDSPSGVALLTDSGRVFAGSYLENAAFNPSLPPLGGALAGYFCAGRKAGSIRAAVLVEKEGSGISQLSSTESALAVLAPGVSLQYVALH